jgi:diguanylate cyclase (GGDEF)-like protein
MRILIVDNDTHTRTALSDFLTDEGYEPTTESSGSAALTRFRQQPFPLVILDQVLVGMNGLDLLARIKAECREAVVIVITSFPALAAAVRALRLEAFDYLIKTGDEFAQLQGTLLRATALIGQQQQRNELTDSLQQRISSLQEENRRLIVDHRDPTTGLEETGQFMNRVQAEIDRSYRHQRHFSVVILRFNAETEIGTTQYKVRALDGNLPLLVQKVRDRLRHSDVLARYDENTLSLILPETGREGALLVAQSIVALCSDIAAALLGEQFTVGHGLLQVGVACFPDDGLDQNELIDRATRTTTDIGSSSVH